METIKTMAGISYVFEDGGGYKWEVASIFNENDWFVAPEVEVLVVKGVNDGRYGRKYEGKYTIFYDLETGANIARRSRKKCKN